MFSVPAPLAVLANALVVGRASMIKFVGVAPKTGWELEMRNSGETCEVKVASTSFSSWMDRAFVRPTIGWLDRVILPCIMTVDQHPQNN
jgi:hypothetical protein